MSRSSVLPLKIPARSAQRLVKSSRLSWLARDNLSSKYIWNCEELAAFPHELRIHICFAHDNFNTGHDAGGLIMMLYLFPDVIKPFRNDDKEEQILFRVRTLPLCGFESLTNGLVDRTHLSIALSFIQHTGMILMVPSLWSKEAM